MILHCNCRSLFQDKLYGEGNRVFNKIVKEGSWFGRCTICKTEKGSGDSDDKKTKGKKGK